MDRFLLLYRIRYENGEWETGYTWCSSEEDMKCYVANKERVLHAKIFVDYGAEIQQERIVLERKYDRNIELGEERKQLLTGHEDCDRPGSGWAYNKKRFEKFGIDIDQEFIAGYPLSVFINFLNWGHALDDIEVYFDPPSPDMKDKILKMFIEAVNICEEEKGSIKSLNDQLVKRTIVKYALNTR